MILGKGERLGEGKGARRETRTHFREKENGKDAAVQGPARGLKGSRAA